jgi:hypothetical protein
MMGRDLGRWSVVRGVDVKEVIFIHLLSVVSVVFVSVRHAGEASVCDRVCV